MRTQDILHARSARECVGRARRLRLGMRALLAVLLALAAPCVAGAQYRVRPGDTLSGIAARHRSSVDALLRANRARVRDPNRLRAGVELNLPRRTARCGEGLVFEELVSRGFAGRVRTMARRLRMDPDHLMAVMHYETAGTFRPSIVNPRSRAVGLIQFLPSTARRMGTSTPQLRRQSAIEQLAWVERYLSHFRGRMRTIEDAYLAVFTPAGIGRAGGYVLHRRGETAYRRNLGHDRDRDGRITVREVGANARRRLEHGRALRAARCR